MVLNEKIANFWLLKWGFVEFPMHFRPFSVKKKSFFFCWFCQFFIFGQIFLIFFYICSMICSFGTSSPSLKPPIADSPRVPHYHFLYEISKKNQIFDANPKNRFYILNLASYISKNIYLKKNYLFFNASLLEKFQNKKSDLSGDLWKLRLFIWRLLCQCLGATLFNLDCSSLFFSYS